MGEKDVRGRDACMYVCVCIYVCVYVYFAESSCPAVHWKKGNVKEGTTNFEILVDFVFLYQYN